MHGQLSWDCWCLRSSPAREKSSMPLYHSRIRWIHFDEPKSVNSTVSTANIRLSSSYMILYDFCKENNVRLTQADIPSGTPSCHAWLSWYEQGRANAVLRNFEAALESTRRFFLFRTLIHLDNIYELRIIHSVPVLDAGAILEDPESCFTWLIKPSKGQKHSSTARKRS